MQRQRARARETSQRYRGKESTREEENCDEPVRQRDMEKRGEKGETEGKKDSEKRQREREE
jgi:hypothetical protein